MKALSVVSDNPFFSEDSEFDLMHIRITVFGLTGILVSKKEDMSGKARKDGLPDLSSVSSVSEEASPLGDVPVYAVVTHKRNASSSATSIASHLPSNPLENSMCSFGNSHRYAASWPAHNSSLITDENDECTPIDQSSLIMERVMMRELYNSISNFVHETVNLEINLKRGDEIIPVGLASLVISGDEDGPITMHLPAQAIRLKGKKIVVAEAVGGKKSRKNRFFSKSVAKPFFPSDKSAEYTLDENAALRIAVHVVPHSTLKETEAAKIRRARSEQRKLEQQAYREAVIRKKYEEQLANGFEDLKLKSTAPTHQPSTSISQLFCSPTTLCGGGKHSTTGSLPPQSPKSRTSSRTSSNASDSFTTLDKSISDSYLRQRGIYDDSSVLSSVSESESESDDEPEQLKLKSIVVRTRTLN
jgi:hypothetical protein